MPTELTANESARLGELEEKIKSGLPTFYMVGEAFKEIKENGLYLAEFRSFELYCSTKWQMTARRANQLASAATTVEKIKASNGKRISHILPILPKNDSHARALGQSNLTPKEQAEILAQVAREGTVTTASIQEAVSDKKNEKAPQTPTMDQLGHHIERDDVRAVFAVRAEMVALLAQISKIKATVIRWRAEPAGKFLHQELVRDLDNAYTGLKFGLPHAVCPPGIGQAHKHDYQAIGWLPREHYERLPKELQT